MDRHSFQAPPFFHHISCTISHIRQDDLAIVNYITALIHSNVNYSISGHAYPDMDVFVF